MPNVIPKISYIKKLVGIYTFYFCIKKGWYITSIDKNIVAMYKKNSFDLQDLSTETTQDIITLIN